MQAISKLFNQHPESVGENYFEHMATSFGFGSKMLVSGLACLIHGIFPFFCVTTGSQTITKLHKIMVTHRDKRYAADTAIENSQSSCQTIRR